MRQPIKDLDRKLLLMDERDLKKAANPADAVNFLRLNFWLEYNYAQEKRKQMRTAHICRGAAHTEYLYGVVLTRPLLLAWVICPPTDYALVQEDLLTTGLDRLRDCLRVDLYTVTVKIQLDPATGNEISRTEKKTLNVAALKEIREITRMLADRVQGSVIQKIALQSKSTNTHHLLGGSNGAPGAAAQTFMPDALDDLNKQLKAVNKQLDLASKMTNQAYAPGGGDVVDVEHTDG